MTHERDTRRLLDRWLADGPLEAPDRVLDAVADRIERQSQLPAWRASLRGNHVNAYLKPLAAIAAVVVIAVAGLAWLGGSSSLGVGGSTPSPSPSPSPSSSAATGAIECEDDLPGCAGPLAPGAHRSSQFEPVLFYETTGEWRNVIDVPTLYKIDPPDGFPYVLVWSDASIADQSDTCAPESDPSLGRRAADWIEFFTTHPGLEATEPVEVHLGKATGWQVELSVASDWTRGCSGSEGPYANGPYVMLLTQPVDGSAIEYGLPPTQRLLVTVADVDDRTVVIESYGSATADGFFNDMQPVRDLIATFELGCGPGSSGPCTTPEPSP